MSEKYIPQIGGGVMKLLPDVDKKIFQELKKKGTAVMSNCIRKPGILTVDCPELKTEMRVEIQKVLGDGNLLVKKVDR